MMKKAKTFLLLGIALCMFGCSDDDDNDNNSNSTATVPFSLTATLEARSDASMPGTFQGDWKAGTQLAALHASLSGVKKAVFTLSSTSTDLFTGELSVKVKNEKEIAVFYPASAITTNSSDTLTQKLSLAGQDGTLTGVENYDYAWALCKVAMNTDTSSPSGSGSCEMTNLMTIGQFQFTTDGTAPLNDISRITVTAASGTIYSTATLKLKDGTFSSTGKGSIAVKNSNGLSGSAYIALFPGEAQLHFTLVTTTGQVFETMTPESVVLEKGKIYQSAPLVCTPASPAKVGDYYFSDGTYSTEENPDKTCIGIIYALDDANGTMNNSLTTSPYGRIVALSNAQSPVKWMSKAGDIEGLEDYANTNGSLEWGCLPYFNGASDSYFSDKAEEQIKGATIDVATGSITAWPSAGALSDFKGMANTTYINGGTSSYPAGTYCYLYGKAGKGAGEWYLPAAGELVLLWELQHAGVITHAKHDCFVDFDQQSYWSSSECAEGTAWHINFFSGILKSNSKASSYYIRPVAQF